MSVFAQLKVPFKEDEIEWRIGQTGKKGNGQIWATCLAYVQARAIMDRLDQVVGPENWKVSYRFIPGSDGISAGVVCELSLRIGSEWITKEDGAEQTDIESFKGGISGALKRAAVLFGIGRYLYNLERSYVTVVERGTRGALYAKSKEGGEFHWLPPNLPAWALPDPSKAKLNGIHADQPEEGDGVHFPFADYVMPGGKHAKRKFKEIPDLGNYIVESEKKFSTKPEMKPAWWDDMVSRAEGFLADLELTQAEGLKHG